MTVAAMQTKGKATRTTPARATFVTPVAGNDVWWRAEEPARAIGAKLVLIPEEQVADALLGPNSHTPFPWSLTAETVDGKTHRVHTKKGWDRLTAKAPKLLSLTADFPKHEGAAIFTRPSLAQATLAKSMRLDGIRTIAETDDNYFANPAHNLHLRQQGYAEINMMDHAKAFASMDACIFSTEYLRDVYWKQFRQRFGKTGLPEMHVCRNHIAADCWPERIERDGPVRVGFMGSTSHLWDVNLIYGAIHLAHGLGCETHFIGYNPANPDPHMPDQFTVDGEPLHLERSEKSQQYIDKWAAVISSHTRWVTPGEYHRTALPLDIMLAPLEGNAFSMSRSDIKAIEGSISGAAMVCANNPVYRDWVHEETCLKANSNQEYGMAVKRLIEDPKLRYELVTNAQEYVLKKRGLKQMRNDWISALDAKI